MFFVPLGQTAPRRSRRQIAIYACLVVSLAAMIVFGSGLSAVYGGEFAAEFQIFALPDQPLARGPVLDAAKLASQVTIVRDAYGVPHIDGRDDLAAIFGHAYAQAEDNFWQVEDSYILSLGRYSEAHGPRGLNSDLLNHAFEIVPRSKSDFVRISAKDQAMCEAFTLGLNYYLEKNPQVKPRLIRQFEPWHVLAFGRHLALELSFRYTRLNSNYLPRSNDRIWAASGSNAWAIGASRTRSGNTMLVVQPHQPWFGFGQMYESHLRSGDGWNFTGSTFLGNPLPTVGHNEHAGWAMTTNEPDIADVWRETFDDPSAPLNYRYGDGYRTAVEWKDVIQVKTASGVQPRSYTFRRTHRGPIVAKEDDQHYLSARVANLYQTLMLHQAARMVRVRDLAEFKAALSLKQYPYMNLIYADKQKNIFFVYNGVIPRRATQFDWSRPLDGSNPATEWQGFHDLSELPQVLNPACGFVQNCNSSPFTTADDGNPDRNKFPAYMVEDRDDDKRRAKISRQLLREMRSVTFEQVEVASYDTTVYWAKQELPRYQEKLVELAKTDADLAARVRPLFDHLLAWDCRTTLDSTAATLCQAWYEELYGDGYPGEKLKPQYAESAAAFRALTHAANSLERMHGDWRVPWGAIHRIQRRPDFADVTDLPFDDALPSLPSLGGHGPMGTVFTQYYTPSINIPFLRTLKKRYGVVGVTYQGVYEFGERIRTVSVLNFGQSGDPASPHYFDQAKLLSEQRMKHAPFYWDEVEAAAKRTYQPGERDLPAK